MNVMEANKKIDEYFNKAVEANNSKDYEGAIEYLKEAGKLCFELARKVPAEKNLAMRRIKMYEEQITKIRNKMNNKSSSTGKKQGEAVTEGSILKYSTNTGVTFDDVVGLENAKKIIKSECVNYFKHPEIFEKFKHKPTKAILLYGVPGTGKTMFAKAVASEVDAPFIHIAGADIKDKYVGESEKNISRIFEELKKHKYAIVFLDEAEELLAVRGRNHNSAVSDALVTNFLKVIDGFDSGNNFLFIAATNMPTSIDPAILSRCRYKLNIALPNEAARRQIISNKLNGVKLAQGLTFDYIAKRTPKYSGRDLENLCGEITRFPIERYFETLDKDTDGVVHDNDYESYITKEDVDKAISIIPSSLSPEAEYQIKIYEKSLPSNERVVEATD